VVETLITTVFKTVRKSRGAWVLVYWPRHATISYRDVGCLNCCAVKPRHAAAALARRTKPFQRLGCVNFGKLRFQKRHKTVRTLHLCDPCLESLLPSQLSDLFLKFGVTQN